ncbi:hypothetical protein [Capnocytophaga sp. oral taxon 864]|uniref:hypothetical protein n=1 Tax=Capnocytophaga sp. oral taxon 864 TaxID=1316593 RepID=UPI000D0336DC|nr:hypothetical protein [Capnocytophaga sp. oral taxon 864]AVM54962.1 hypothetical protein C3V44_04525 [Capnocytophaga sp. oral taxon 864]
MKRIYLLGALLTAVLAISCTPDTKELDVLKEPAPTVPQVSNPPVDLSKTLVIFSPNETIEKIFRDPTSKTISATTFTFTPKFAKRALQNGEVINLKIETEKVGYERSLPEGSFTIEKAELSSGTVSKTFKVTLKPYAFKDLDITKEYTLRFRVKVTSTTPTDLPVATSDQDSAYRIKISFTEEEYPQGDNIELINADTIDDDKKLDSNKYTFDSNYKSDRLGALKDENYNTNWWINTEEEVYLKTTFTEETTVRGVIIVQNQRWAENKTIGGVDIYATPDNIKEYLQGTYTRDEHRKKLCIKFKVPIKVRTLTFKNFKKYNNQYIDVYEVEFF